MTIRRVIFPESLKFDSLLIFKKGIVISYQVIRGEWLVYNLPTAGNLQFNSGGYYLVSVSLEFQPTYMDTYKRLLNFVFVL